MKRVLVTGGAGFVGRWLLPALTQEGAQVWAVTIDSHVPAPSPSGVPSLPADVCWLHGDLRDDDFVRSVVDAAKPDVVIHLAAISHLVTAAADPAMAWDVNVTASARLLYRLEAARAEYGIDPVVLLAGSAEQYGADASHVQPLVEESVLAPRTVYAATKVAMEVLALQCWRSTGLQTIIARSFNHSGPGQLPRFLLPALVSRVREAGKRGAGSDFPVGNMTPIRDFLHVRDVAAAYISLCRRGVPGEVYNVASGTGWSVREVLERVMARAGVRVNPVEDPSLVRPVDVPVLIGDSRKLQQATGWRASLVLDDIIDDLFHAETY